jgi:hypothetical protein
MIIPASEIEKAYKRVFTVSWWEKLFGIACIRFADANYKPVDPDILLEVLGKDKTDQMVYSRDENGQPMEWFDCDDFTFALMGAFHKDYKTAAMPIFITWVPTIQHALISFYYDGEIFVIEPQTDEIYWLPEGEWKLSLVCG